MEFVMAQEIVPCISFPTTLVFVDDDEKALKWMDGILGRERVLKLYKDPKAALKFLKENYYFEPFTKRCVQKTEEPFPDQPGIDVKIPLIRKEVFNSNRSKDIGIVIIDFAMPDINGGEVAEQLKGSPFKIILLTGEASAQTAVKLFNEGAIHAYIRKDDPQFKIVLLQTIKNLQQQYFQDLSAVVANSLVTHKWPKDPNFKKIFDQICDENNITEYYLLDEFGSYQLLDAKGKVSFLAVANDELMKAYLLYAEGDEAEPAIVEGIRSKTKIPFFYSEKDFTVRPAEWGPYLHPAQVLKGLENYYYSYITNPDTKIYKLEDKVFSYDEFMRAQG